MTDTEEKEQVNRFAVGTVATKTEDSVIDNETGKAITQLDILVEIGNDLQEIKKSLVG